MAQEIKNVFEKVKQTLTLEQIAQNYKAALDSVSLINSFVESAPVGFDEDERKEAIKANVAHLEIMLAKTYWTTEDLAPFSSAIAAGKTFLG